MEERASSIHHLTNTGGNEGVDIPLEDTESPTDDKQTADTQDGMEEYAAGYTEHEPENPKTTTSNESHNDKDDTKGHPFPNDSTDDGSKNAQRNSPASDLDPKEGKSDAKVDIRPKCEDTTKTKSSDIPKLQYIKRDTKDPEPKVPMIPDTNIGVAFLVTLCFNLPLGILAVYFSLMATKAFRDGKTEKGEKRARISTYISLFSIVVTVLVVMFVVLYLAMQGQAARRRYATKTSVSL